MNKFIFAPLCILFFSFSQAKNDSSEKIKYRKLSYEDFKKISSNDTALAVIDLFFSKKDNALQEQTPFLPISIALVALPNALTKVVGAATLVVTAPLFISAIYKLRRYRKKRLFTILSEYENTRKLPDWVSRKLKKHTEKYEEFNFNY